MYLSKSSTNPPKVAGIVGHRRLREEDLDLLKAALLRELTALQESYSPTKVVLLSSLAQGADILAAKVARECGITVRGALPMPPEAFRASTSFDNDQARQEFDKISQPPTDCFVVEMPAWLRLPPQKDWAKIANSPEPIFEQYRRKIYAFTGLYVVRHCDVLIALWDGNQPDPEHPSGTAEHVRTKLTGIPPVMLSDGPYAPPARVEEIGPVIVLHTPRDSEATNRLAGTRKIRRPEST